MSVQTNFPAVKPTLLLDFANTKKLDPRITFTRTTTATYYDGVTTAMAEQNLVLYSQEFDNITGWNPIRTSISANTTTAPDGTSTADSLIEDSSASINHYVQINTAAAGNFNSVVVNGSSITFSIFAKANTRTQVCLGFWDGSTVHTAFFDLSGGTVLSSSGVTASIVNAGNGWYRCVGVRTNTTTTMALSIQLSVSGSTTYTGNGTSGIYIWGAQLEQRSSVTAYTATTTQPITNYIPVLQTAVAGQARFDHNPTTDESLGLLVEEARTNLFLRSEEFDNAYWTKSTATITANNVVAPNGTLTADTFTVPSSPGYGSVYISIALTATQYTMSVFAKGSATVFMYLATSGFGTGGWGEYNLSTGAVTRITNFGATTGSTASMTPVGNGWYRCSLTVLCTATTYVPIIGTYVPSAVIWGAQLEAGAFATSYIATTSATVTRNADVASMTGSNFTSWFNNAEGTLYAEHQKLGTATFQRVVGMSDGGFDNRIYIGYGSGNPNNLEAIVTVSGFSQAGFVVVTSSAINTSYKVATAYATNNFAGVANAGTVGTDAIGTIPVVNRLNIGIGDNTSSNPLNGTIKKVAYYPVRITNANLQALTS